MGCLKFPSNCGDNDCNTILTYIYNPQQNTAEFTMQSTAGWSSIAFNDARQMVGLCSHVYHWLTISP